MNRCFEFGSSWNFINTEYKLYQLIPSYDSNKMSISILEFSSDNEDETLFMNVPNKYLLMEFDGEKRTFGEGIDFLENRIGDKSLDFSCAEYNNFFRFIAIILRKENKFAFEKIMCCKDEKENNLASKLFGGRAPNNATLILNLCKLDGNILEKLIKSFGDEFIVKNLAHDKIVFDSGTNKLNKALSVPKELMKRIAEDLPTALKSFQTICGICDGNDAIYLVNFLDKIYGNVTNEKTKVIKTVAEILEHRKTAMPTLLTYIFRQQYYNTYSNRNGFLSINSFCNAAITLRDTLIMHEKLMQCKMESLPSDLFYEHLVLAENIKAMDDNPILEQNFMNAVKSYSDLNFASDKFIIRAPENSNELIVEGTTLRHCVASYKERIANDGCIVMFCRKVSEPDTPFVTVEFHKEFGVVQLKTFCDKDVMDEDVLEFMHTWEEEIDKREEVQCA